MLIFPVDFFFWLVGGMSQCNSNSPLPGDFRVPFVGPRLGEQLPWTPGASWGRTWLQSSFLTASVKGNRTEGSAWLSEQPLLWWETLMFVGGHQLSSFPLNVSVSFSQEHILSVQGLLVLSVTSQGSEVASWVTSVVASLELSHFLSQLWTTHWS